MDRFPSALAHPSISVGFLELPSAHLSHKAVMLPSTSSSTPSNGNAAGKRKMKGLPTAGTPSKKAVQVSSVPISPVAFLAPSIDFDRFL